MWDPPVQHSNLGENNDFSIFACISFWRESCFASPRKKLGEVYELHMEQRRLLFRGRETTSDLNPGVYPTKDGCLANKSCDIMDYALNNEDGIKSMWFFIGHICIPNNGLKVVMLLSSKPKWSPGIPKWSATVVTSLQGNRRQYSKHVSPPLECSHLLVLLPNWFCWCFSHVRYVWPMFLSMWVKPNEIQ